MNPAPEDPLARMARWDALRRRVDGQLTGGDRSGSPIDELAAATRRVVEQDPSASVMITVRSGGGTASVRVAQVNGEVAVTVTSAEPPAGPRELPPGGGPAEPAGPEYRAAPAEPAGDERSSQIIAELADLLRRDPSFLTRPH